MRRLSLFAVACVVTFSGCYPEYFQSASESDVVITVEDPDTDYRSLKTYVLSDQVYDLEDLSPPSALPSPQKPYEALILQTIGENMEAYGYQLESDPVANPPDVAVFVGTVVTDTWSWTLYPIWDPWWGYLPPVYYPPVAVPSNYKYGTMLMSMVAVGDRMEGDPVQVLWVGVADGLLSSRSSTNAQRVEDVIDQAFRQSPYLNQEER